MIAKKSPLIFQSFLLLKLEYNLTPKPPVLKNRQNEVDLLNEYPIDINFFIRKGKKDENLIYLKIGINKSTNSLPGYMLFAEGVGIFEFEKSAEFDENQKSTLLHYSGLSICINSIRGILSNTTSNSPMEKYTLPSIDVNELLKEKELMQQKNSSDSKPRIGVKKTKTIKPKQLSNK